MDLAGKTLTRCFGQVDGAKSWWLGGVMLLVLSSALGVAAGAQQAAESGAKAAEPAANAAKADGEVVGDTSAPVAAPAAAAAPVVAAPVAVTPAERERAAWTLLENSLGDAKHPQARIQALAALGLLRSTRSLKMIVDAMGDTDVDVRTAAVLAAGETKDRNLTTNIRNMLDDKEPQVAFSAAMTLWKMGDKSGEDILVAVVDGERSASAGMMHGTGHKLSRDLHDPATLARVGAMQGASMILGPFGFGITAFEYVHENGGDLARVSAIEQIAQERTEPIHHVLVAALGDKDPTVRATAAKALVEYKDKATSDAVYALLADAKQPVRLTAAAAYLRTTGTAGSMPEKQTRERTLHTGK